MSEDFLHVLLYLFDNYQLPDLMACDDLDGLLDELHYAGFEQNISLNAVEWLQGIKHTEQTMSDGSVLNNQSLRVFNEIENLKISTEARGFILFLEQHGFIDAMIRELIIDRAMALETAPILLVEIRCIANMVLSRTRTPESNLSLIADWLINEKETLH